MLKASKRRAANEAKKLLERYNIIMPPVPIEKIAKKYGAQVRHSPLDDELSGMVFIKDSVPIIGINAHHHPNRQRFSVAHELGHLILHRQEITREVHVDKTSPYLLRSTMSSEGVDPMEIEANTFAAELLMPEPLVRQALSKTVYGMDEDQTIEGLARLFRVSTQAMGLRLGNLETKRRHYL